MNLTSIFFLHNYNKSITFLKKSKKKLTENVPIQTDYLRKYL